MTAVSRQLRHRKCRHCGSRFEPRHAADEYCCQGCALVREMIEGAGFSDFYRLLGDKTLLPQGENLGTSLDWIESGELGQREELTFQVANLSCTACVWLIERIFHRQPGALRIAVDSNRSLLTLWRDVDTFSLSEFARSMHRFGYPLSEYHGEAADDDAHSESKALLTRLGVTAGLWMNTMAFTLPVYLGLAFEDELAALFRMVAFASATLALLVGGSVFFQRAWLSLRIRAIHMDVPISLGLLAAYAGSIAGYATGNESLVYFDFVATFVTLMLLGRWFHVRLIEKNRRQLGARERRILSLTRGNVVLKPTEIETGDAFTAASESLVPVKSILRGPESAAFTLDWINGEPDPIEIQAGSEVPAGARNVSSTAISLEAREAFSGSLVEKLLRSPSPSTVLFPAAYPNILQIYLIAVVVVAFGGAITWFFASGDLARSLNVLISILVVSCPCALGLALPLLDDFVNSRMRQQGIFVRHLKLWQKLPQIRYLVFDKTGTLTEPVPRWLNPEVLDELDDPARNALDHLIRENCHPFASALREGIFSHLSAKTYKKDSELVEIHEMTANGVSCRLDGTEWRFGKASWAAPDFPRPAASVLSRDGKALAEFIIGEAIRPGAREEMAALQAGGYHIQILSGDPDRERVLETGRQLGLAPESIFSSQSPDEKAAHILGIHPEETLFVGDGGNDSLALDSASCTGSPATGIRAIEGKADFVFMGRNFRAIRKLLDLSGKRRTQVRRIFCFAVLYNLAAIAICLSGAMNPLLAAILMPLSSLISISIAARV